MSRHLTLRQIVQMAEQLVDRRPEVVDAALDRIDLETKIAIRHQMATQAVERRMICASQAEAKVLGTDQDHDFAWAPTPL